MLILGGQSTLNLERICKDFGRIASDLLGGGVDWHSTWKGSTKTLEGSRRIASDPGGVQLTLNLERICKDFGRIASDPGGGGRLTLNLERIHKDFGRIASDNVDPGGSINTQLGKDLQRLLKDHLWQCWSQGGQLTFNLERICKDFGRIASDNVDPEGGSIDTQLRKDLQRLWKDCLWSFGVVDRHSTWKGSTKTLEGSRRIASDPGGRGVQSTLNLERIHKDFGRIWKDRLWSWGVDWHSTWEGSAKTLEGPPLTMLILEGSIDTQLGKDLQRLWKDHLWQCWSQGWINIQLGKDLQRLWKDRLWQCWS